MNYNLQSEVLKEDYWPYMYLEPLSLQKEFYIRAAASWIFIIKGGNAFLMISLPLILLYEWRFHPFISVHIPRFFLVLSSIFQLLMFSVFMSSILYFSYNIISVLTYNTPKRHIEDADIDGFIKGYL